MEAHKNPLRRNLQKLAHLGIRDHRDKKKHENGQVIMSPLKLEHSVQFHGVSPALDFKLHRDTQEESKSMSMSTEDTSKHSSIHLRSITSAPALANKPINFGSNPKAEDALGSCGLFYLENFAEQTAASFPERQSTSAPQHSWKSSINGMASPISEHFRIKSPSITSPLHTCGQGRDTRIGTRSRTNYTRGTSPESDQEVFPLQSTMPDNTDAQEAALKHTNDPESWSVITPSRTNPEDGIYSLEQRAERLFSADHLRVILEEPKLLSDFTNFLRAHRPWRLTLLSNYWDAVKALRAIHYARAISITLSEKPLPCTESAATLPGACIDGRLSDVAGEAFDDLIREDLVAYVAHAYTRIVSASVQRRITGSLSSHLREASQGLAEVFVLTDPSRHDNPIILSSEEFALTTGYGLKYIIGRNCRFLQGPSTSEHSVRRLAIACEEGKEHTELLVNYRRDGTPFLNLLMIVPLLDTRGDVRYFLGAQVDVSGLLRDINSLESVRRLLTGQKPEDSCKPTTPDRLQAMKSLSLMLGGDEVDMVRRHGGYLSQGYSYLHDTTTASLEKKRRTRILLQGNDEDFADELEGDDDPKEDHSPLTAHEMLNKRFVGVYQNYLVVRPAPSLRILFASASLRMPGLLQSHLIHHIGGSSKIRVDFERSLQKGTAVTARLHWLNEANRYGEGVARVLWLHCTPLLHHSGAVGAWVVVVVEEEQDAGTDYSGPRERKREWWNGD